MMMTRFSSLLIALGLAIASPADAAKKTPSRADPAKRSTQKAESDGREERSAAKPSTKITGTYSTLKSIGGDDDMIGIEVIIVRGREGFS